MIQSNAFMKDPAESKFDCFFDWTDWLQVGETITSYTVTAQEGITLVGHAKSDALISVRLAGGALGQVYVVRCQVWIDGIVGADRDPVRSIFIKMVEK